MLRVKSQQQPCVECENTALEAIDLHCTGVYFIRCATASVIFRPHKESDGNFKADLSSWLF